MTCSIFAHRLFRHFTFILAFSILFTLQLSAQNGGLKDELSQSLSGKTVISTIIFGEREVPTGHSSDCPVDTIVYPAGSEVAYRMDFGGTSSAITIREMHRYFDRGTSFQVSSFDLQDGWLDLKLKSAGGDYAQLRLMLGDGWQSRFDASSNRAQLAYVLILDQPPLPKQRTTVPAGFEATFSQKEHDAPSKASHPGAGSGGEVFVNFGRTS